MNYLRVYLKICEGCGVLWLRSGELDGIYCQKCCAVLSDFPAPHAGKCRNRRAASKTPTGQRCRSSRARHGRAGDASPQAQPMRNAGGEL